jgi:hypothetical protein
MTKSKEGRRIADFIMGATTGFCFFYGTFIGYASGTLMLISFVIYDYRVRMMDKLDQEIAKDKREEENAGK